MEHSDEEETEVTRNPYSGENRLKSGFTAELSIFLTMFGYSLGATAIYNLIMYRTCVHALDHTAYECRSFLEPETINHTQELEREVQEYITRVTSLKSLLEGLGPAVLSLFIGAWSDRHGRKPLLVWPMFGITVSAMLTVVYSLREGLGPWWVILTVLPFTISGGFGVLVTGAICFVRDVTTKDNRSIRIVLVLVVITVASSSAALISPYVLKAVGTVYLLLMMATLNTFGYALANVFVREPMQNAEEGTILTVFNVSHPKEMIRVCTKHRPNRGRTVLLLLLTASSLSVFTIYCQNLIYLFGREKLQWTMKDFTTYSSTSSAMWLIGSFVGVTVVQKLIRISDMNLVVVAYVSCIFEFIIKGLATKTWHMYFGSAISFFGTLTGPLMRSFLTKTIPGDEIAKVFGLISSAESFVTLLSPLAYNSLYTVTISVFPGSIMIFTAFINAACLAIIITVQYLRWKSRTGSYEIIQSDDES